MDVQPPPQKSERSFRRYEPHIFTILQRWPDTTAFDPRPLAATTFAARLRDAINSAIEFQWTSCVDISRLRDLWNSDLDIKITSKGQVLAGKRGTGDLVAGATHPTRSSQLAAVGRLTKELKLGEFLIEIDNPSQAVLHALALLYSEKLLPKPTKITNLLPPLVEEVEALHDVVISREDGEDYFVMV